MKKMRRFLVVYVYPRSKERLCDPYNMASVFHDLQKFGIAVTKIRWKNENLLKLRVGIDPPEHIGKFLTTRESAVSVTVDKCISYFNNKDAVVVTTGKFAT